MKRASTENSAIDMLKASYRNYIQSSKHEENIASLLVQEWTLMTSVDNSDSSNPMDSVLPSANLGVSTPIIQIQSSNIPTDSTPNKNSGSTKIQLSHTNYAMAVMN